MYKIYFHITDCIEIYSNNMDKLGAPEPTIEAPVEDIHSPAATTYQSTIDLNTTLNRNPGTTFYCKIKNNAFLDEGVSLNDLLIIDRSIPFTHGKIVLCYWEGRHFIRRVSIGLDAVINLKSSNTKNDTIEITKDNKSMIWGVISYVLRKL